MDYGDILVSLLTDPNSARTQFDEFAERLDPMIQGVAKKIVDYIEEYADNCERIKKSRARIDRTAFDAYCEVGFTEEQAMALILKNKERIEKLANTGIQVSKRAAGEFGTDGGYINGI